MTTTPTNDTDLNRKIIRAAFEAWQAGSAPIADVFADDMVWRIEGHSFASKQYDNKRQFIDEVLAPFGARFAAGERFRPTNIRSVHADADTVIVLWDGEGVANDGAPYKNSYAWFMRIARRQGDRRHRVLRQHLVQRSLDPRAAERLMAELQAQVVSFGRSGAVVGEALDRGTA